MNHTVYKYAGLFYISLLFLSCHERKEGVEVEKKSIALVKVLNIQYKDMVEQVKLTATSVYLQRSQVNAPVAGYITNVRIKYGDAVTRGQVLYEIETKERAALGNTTVNQDTTLSNFGKILIKAPANGVITTIDRQQPGEYVMEGNPFCTITQSGDLAFQLNVPYEYHSIVLKNNFCSIVLPDNSQVQGKIIKPLSSLNVTAQTQQYLVKPVKYIFLPEGLVATVLLTTSSERNTQILPKECVLSDELMKKFWIMKLINDTTAIKVDIKVGIRNTNEIEIISPKLSTEDRILSEGNYGLADTAFVKIIKQ